MSLEAAVTALTGQALLYKERLHGGDLSEVFRLTLAPDHATVVAKRGPMVTREARMLEAMAEAGAPVPDVIGVHGDLMLMEDLPEGRLTPDIWGDLGAQLSAMHVVTGPYYGWPEDYAFGAVAIPNAPCPNWPAFWAERRLMAAPDALPSDLARRVEALAVRLPELLPEAPPASLLHGDLWQGNLLACGGQARMIDPACYYGHAEVDLAMLDFFGRPAPDFTRRYGAPEPGAETRRPLYQLWPALVHLRLFGAGYRPVVEGLLTRAGA